MFQTQKRCRFEYCNTRCTYKFLGSFSKQACYAIFLVAWETAEINSPYLASRSEVATVNEEKILQAKFCNYNSIVLPSEYLSSTKISFKILILKLCISRYVSIEIISPNIRYVYEIEKT